MKILKSAAVATTLALSLGTFSTSTYAVCLGMACMYNRMTPIEGINATLGQVGEALTAIKARSSGGAEESSKTTDEAIIVNIKDALKLSKEINANDKLDRNRNRANDSLKKARTAVQAGDLMTATAFLTEAETRFSELKGMIDLTQADRVSQQTNLLNRILDTDDNSAGARSAAESRK
jgi:hypothetical protein